MEIIKNDAREDGESMSEVVSVSEMFGKDVFNDAVMKDRLPKSVYKKLKKTIEDGAELDPSIADVVAHAMKIGPLNMAQPIYPLVPAADRSNC